jgi:hypothetical protein
MDALEELLGDQARGCWSLPHHTTNYVSTTRSSSDGDGAIDKSTTSIPSTSISPQPPPPSDVSADSTTPPPEGALLPTDKRSANSIRGNLFERYYTLEISGFMVGTEMKEKYGGEKMSQTSATSTTFVNFQNLY